MPTIRLQSLSHGYITTAAAGQTHCVLMPPLVDLCASFRAAVCCLWGLGEAAMVLQKGSCTVPPLDGTQRLGWVSLLGKARSCAHTSCKGGWRKKICGIFSLWGGRQALPYKVVIPQTQEDSLDTKRLYLAEGLTIRR